jgi:hypothetical protein
MPNRGSFWKTLALFALGGGLALGLFALRHLPSAGRPNVDVLGFSTILEGILTSPSVFFAIAMVLAGFLAANLGYLPGRMDVSRWRVVGGTLVAAVAYPISMLGIVLVAMSLMEPMDSDNPHPLPVPGWRHWVGESAPYVGLFIGGVLTICLMMLAFRIATKKWPRRIWASALVVALGVPSVTALIGYRFARSPELLLIEPTIGRIPLLLVIGEIVLAMVIGGWLFSAADSSPSSSG